MKAGESGWDSLKETRVRPPYAWHAGYFRDAHYGWDGQTYVKNYNELRCRDLAVMALAGVAGRRVLDIGCGRGAYLITLARLGAEVCGQDINPAFTRVAQESLKVGGFAGVVETGDATTLLFPDNSFDAVFSADFLSISTCIRRSTSSQNAIGFSNLAADWSSRHQISRTCG